MWYYKYYCEVLTYKSEHCILVLIEYMNLVVWPAFIS